MQICLLGLPSKNDPLGDPESVPGGPDRPPGAPAQPGAHRTDKTRHFRHMRPHFLDSVANSGEGTAKPPTQYVLSAIRGFNFSIVLGISKKDPQNTT